MLRFNVDTKLCSTPCVSTFLLHPFPCSLLKLDRHKWQWHETYSPPRWYRGKIKKWKRGLIMANGRKSHRLNLWHNLQITNYTHIVTLVFNYIYIEHTQGPQKEKRECIIEWPKLYIQMTPGPWPLTLAWPCLARMQWGGGRWRKCRVAVGFLALLVIVATNETRKVTIGHGSVRDCQTQTI